jgi:stage II sporulation protein D
MAAPYPLRNAVAQPLWRTGACLLLVLTALAVSAASASAATTFFIRGGGYGHGIGMSQYGADGYALHGRHYRWILAHYYRGTKLTRVSAQRTVRVLVSTSANAFGGASSAAGHHLNPSKTYTVRPNADGSLTVMGPRGKKVLSASAPLRVLGPGPLSLAGVGSYRGSLEFRPSGGGLEVVDAVGLDDYVRGVVAAEMPASFAPEALKVQAVAARTYALTSDVGGVAFDLYADTRSQMYGGVGAETSGTDAAVAGTAGQIVTYAGSPVVTYFSSSSGGHTENIENVWPGARPEPWLKGVPDVYDGAAGDPYHRWGSDLSLAQASGKLAGFFKGRLLGVRVTQHGSSPRILRARVVGTRGSSSVTGTQLQQAFGLLTTYAWFTSVNTYYGWEHGLVRSYRRAFTSSARSGAVTGMVRVQGRTLPGLHGSVFPAPQGARIAIQRLRRGHWRTVQHAQLGAGGSYDTGLAPGRYRVLYRGLGGPTVSVR